MYFEYEKKYKKGLKINGGEKDRRNEKSKQRNASLIGHF